jgi:signal transduction histidine kinase
MSLAQLQRLALTLATLRIGDPQNLCFVGGGLHLPEKSALRVVDVDNVFLDEPFLILIGPNGSLALLSQRQGDQICSRLFTDPDVADRAILVLAQFVDYPYNASSTIHPAAQSALVAAALEALQADPELNQLPLDSLVMQESSSSALAVTGPFGAMPTMVSRASSENGTQAVSPMFEALFRTLADAILLCDGSGQVVALNPAAGQLLKMSEPLIGKPLSAGPLATFAPLLQAAQNGLTVQTEMLFNDQALQVQIASLGNDLWSLTLRPHVPSPALQQQPAEPESQAPQSNASQRWALFVVNFSQMVREPLQDMREQLLQIPAVDKLSEKQTRMVGEAIRINGDLLMQLNVLLDIGQRQLYAQEQARPLRLDLLVHAAVDTQYAESGRRGQTVTVEISEGLPLVWADEESIGTAIAALIDNAIKYSSNNAQIAVTCGVHNNNVILTVADTGPGLTSEEQALIFEPFYRAPSTAERGGAGRGLGLTVARAAIEQHHGQIWVTSEPGKGTSVAFTLPIYNAP